MFTPDLSIALITRDEEKNLPGLLNSLEPLRSRLNLQTVVTDTGSVDRTVELAREVGAEVHTFDWCDDFSKARNAGLERCRAPWILWLDADDRLSSEAGEWLASHAKTLNTDDKLGGNAPRHVYLFNIHSPMSGGGSHRFLQIRLFPNRPDLRFENPIHESLAGAADRAGLTGLVAEFSGRADLSGKVEESATAKPIGADASLTGKSAGSSGEQGGKTTGVTIEHHGYADEASLKQKMERNKKLLESLVQKGEAGPSLMFSLARTYQVEKRWADALKLYDDILRHCDPSDRPDDDKYREKYRDLRLASIIYKGQTLGFSGQLEEARRWFEQHREAGDNHLQYLFEYGKCLLVCGRKDEARDVFQKARVTAPGEWGIPTDWNAIQNGLRQLLFELDSDTTASHGLQRKEETTKPGYTNLQRDTLGKSVPSAATKPHGLPEDLNQAFGTIAAPLNSSHPKNTLSVVMIVKNESKNIREAVASIRPIADEMVVNDTGSTDGTQEILKELGVKWFQSDWRDDFSLARNQTLERASCSWILWLDADDRIPPDQVENFNKLKTAPRDRIFGFQVINTQGGQPLGARFMQVRMFPNHPGIRFERRIHEQMIFSAARLGLHCMYTETTIHHTGYEDAEQKKAKARRNLELAYQEESLLGTDPTFTMGAGDAHFILGEWEKGIAMYRKAFDIPEIRKKNKDAYGMIPCYIGLGYHNLNRHSEAIEWLDRAIGLSPHLVEPPYHKALSQKAMGKSREAEATLTELLKMPLVHSSVANQYDGIRIYSYHTLAEWQIQNGRFEEARSVLKEMCEHYPQVVEGWMKLGLCHHRLGQWKEAADAWIKAVRMKPDKTRDVFHQLIPLLQRIIPPRLEEEQDILNLYRHTFGSDFGEAYVNKSPATAHNTGTAAPRETGSAPVAGATAANSGEPHAASAVNPDAGSAESQSASPTLAPKSTSQPPSLSVCLIVKNEEKNMEDCLRSLAPLNAELIVADTGSTDRTVELAKAQGAKIIHIGWENDFSKARNAGLDKAGCPWILWVDADDRLPPETAKALPRLLEQTCGPNWREGGRQGGNHAFGFLVQNTGNQGATGSVFNQIRLFPNHPNLRFTAPVHEQILPALEKEKVPVTYTDLKIFHTGYTDEQTARKKQIRNKDILLRQVSEGKNVTPVTLYTLAHAQMDLGENEEAIENFLQAAELAEKTGTDPHVLQIGAAKVATALAKLGRLEEARNILEVGLKRVDIHPETVLLKAQVEEKLGNLEEAGKWYIRLLEFEETSTFIPVDYNRLKIMALEFLGKYWAARGEMELAKQLLRDGIQIQSGTPYDRKKLEDAYSRYGVKVEQ